MVSKIQYVFGIKSLQLLYFYWAHFLFRLRKAIRSNGKQKSTLMLCNRAWLRRMDEMNFAYTQTHTHRQTQRYRNAYIIHVLAMACTLLAVQTGVQNNWQIFYSCHLFVHVILYLFVCFWQITERLSRRQIERERERAGEFLKNVWHLKYFFKLDCSLLQLLFDFDITSTIYTLNCLTFDDEFYSYQQPQQHAII